MRELSILGVVLGVVCGWTAAAHAQAETTDEDRQIAREAYARGQAEFDAGHYEASEAAFAEAYEHVPNPVVLLGVAEARERLGNIPGTIEALETYLAERTDAPDRAAIEARLTGLRARPGILEVRSTPPGATIELDGTDTGRTTPADLEASSGSHTLVLRLAGHADSTLTVETGPGARVEAARTLESSGDGLDGVGDPIDPVEGEDGAAEAADDGPGAAVWVTSALAAVSLVGGTVLGFLALSQEAEFEDDPTVDRADKGERFALFADVLFGVAAVSAITALVLFLANDAGDEDDEASSGLELSPVMGRRAGGVQARLRF